MGKQELKNCEKCGASYAPYKVGPGEDMGSKWCQLSVSHLENEVWVKDTPQGVCQFCNPKSRLFLDKVTTQ